MAVNNQQEMKTKNMTTPHLRKSISRLPLRLAFLLIPLTLASSALAQYGAGRPENPPASPRPSRPSKDIGHGKQHEKSDTEKAKVQKAFAAIDRNKAEHEALVKASKARNPKEISAILRRHGLDVGRGGIVMAPPTQNWCWYMGYYLHKWYVCPSFNGPTVLAPE
jgi:hypothetical protein